MAVLAIREGQGTEPAAVTTNFFIDHSLKPVPPETSRFAVLFPSDQSFRITDMAKSLKIPKKIAGVKVPKRLRKSGKSLAHLLDSPIGRQAAAAALTAAAGVLAGTNRNLRHGVEQTGEAVAHAATEPGGLVRSMAEAAVGAVADTAQEMVGPSQEPKKDVRQNAG